MMDRNSILVSSAHNSLKEVADHYNGMFGQPAPGLEGYVVYDVFSVQVIDNPDSMIMKRFEVLARLNVCLEKDWRWAP